MSSTSIHVKDFRTEIPGELSEDRTTWNFPVVNSTNAHGKKTFWKIYVRLFRQEAPDVFIPCEDVFFDSKPMPANIFAWIKVDSGITEAKKSVPTIIRQGRNIGRSSATNVWTQALRDALGTYNKQLKKSAQAPAVSTTELFPPMLAKVFKDLTEKPLIDADHPVFVQRKYNGVRTVTTLEQAQDGTYRAIMYSRHRTLYLGLSYIRDELLPVLQFYWEAGRRLYLDGEIYKHGVPLQDISGAARRETTTFGAFDYMIYDCFVPDEPMKYSERKQLLDDIFSEFQFKYAKNVETFTLYSFEEVNVMYNIFLEEEFEGAMIRTDSEYQYSYNELHSSVLLKMKPTYDHEYTVVGFTTGDKGKAAAALMIICANDAGKTFPVTPAMELPDRIALAKKMAEVEQNQKTHFQNHWEGKKIIVTFDEKSRDDIPLRARTKLVQRTWD